MLVSVFAILVFKLVEMALDVANTLEFEIVLFESTLVFNAETLIEITFDAILVLLELFKLVFKIFVFKFDVILLEVANILEFVFVEITFDVILVLLELFKFVFKIFEFKFDVILLEVANILEFAFVE